MMKIYLFLLVIVDISCGIRFKDDGVENLEQTM